MSVVHFLNVLEGDCNIIQHDSTRISVIDVSNAYNKTDTAKELAAKQLKETLAKTRGKPPKINYRQKEFPDNPIDYFVDNIKKTDIFRFIITHPDMDHLDGIKDFFETFSISNIWDTNNKKVIKDFEGGLYNSDDWEYYISIRDGAILKENRRTYLTRNSFNFFDEDNIKILAPNQKLIDEANKNGDYNDSSYVLLYTPPKKDGNTWKILLAGDSHDKTWEMILADPELKKQVTNVDILFAPHHGRDSNRSYDFLKILTPTVTLFGNASSEHLAYDKYRKLRITNNQAGYVIMDINQDRLVVYIKNKEYADFFCKKRGWAPSYNSTFKAYGIIQYTA